MAVRRTLKQLKAYNKEKARAKTKSQIAKEFEKITFTKMSGVNKRSKKELQNVLRFEKKLRKRRR